MAKKTLYILLFILFIAGILRFFNFTATNVITDEASIGVRAIGLIDFDASPTQTSPWQWLPVVPSWMHLSMHDHPILVFFIQHIFLIVFGINMWGLRLAMILAGLLSVYLIFLIGKKLINERAGLIAAALMAVNIYPVWISRIGLQESLVILFIIFSFYYFLRSLTQEKKMILCLIFLGLALLSKYTALILIPIFFLIAWQQKKIIFWLKNKFFYLGLLFLLIIISPSIIYNLKMRHSFGHLDFQLSAALGQNVPEWSNRLGREIVGTLSERIALVIPNLKNGASWPLFIVFILSFFWLIWHWLKNIYYRKTAPAEFILLATIILWLLWFFVVGAELRFISYLIPFLILTTAWRSTNIYDQIKNNGFYKKIFLAMAGLIIIGEIFFTVNTLLTNKPAGAKNLCWSPIYYEIKDWGLDKLDNYLNQLLNHQTPRASFTPRYQFLTDLKNKKTATALKNNLPSVPLLIIYDANLNDMAALWLFHRRAIYESWPIITADDFINIINQNQLSDYQKMGITNFYFIALTNESYLKKQDQTSAGQKLENILQKNNIIPEKIFNRNGQTVFHIYQFKNIK